MQKSIDKEHFQIRNFLSGILQLQATMEDSIPV
jgi:hypothetical protein